jgi:hypothetical protein
MLLSLLGIPTTRVQALRLFHLRRSNSNYVGASHSEIGNAFAKLARVRRWYWECQRRFDFHAVSKSLRTQLSRNNQPTLLSFGAIHSNGEWRCFHVVVAIGVTDEFIEVLDPLGGWPLGTNGNACFASSNSRKTVRVIGSPYSINPATGAAVLHWVADDRLWPATKNGGFSWLQ